MELCINCASRKIHVDSELVGNRANNVFSIFLRSSSYAFAQYGAISLVCPRMSCGVIEGCGSGWVDSCQGKIKRVSSGVGERGASDGGPCCSNPTSWITWPLYNCVRGALPKALSLLNRPGLAQRGSCLPPSLLSPPSCSFPILHFCAPLFPCSLFFLVLVWSCEPTVWGGNHYLSSIPQLSSGCSLLLWWPTSSFCAFWSFHFLFSSFSHNGVHFAAVDIVQLQISCEVCMLEGKEHDNDCEDLIIAQSQGPLLRISLTYSVISML